MNAAQIRYAVEEAGTMMARRAASNVVSIVIMGLSLLILVVFLLVTINVQAVIDRAGEEMRVYVYLKDGATEATIREIQMKLLALEGAEEVVFTSKEEALRTFRETLGENKDMLDAIDDNPLPDAFRVKIKPAYIRSDYLERMSKDVGSWSGVEEARYGERWLERGEKLVHGFYVADLFIGVIIFLSVIFVIVNTVRITVLSRRRTIEVATLVGATNAYVRIPFLVEGAVQGAVASGLALGLLALMHLYARHYLPGLLFLEGKAIAAFILLCAILGALGSFFAMRRFLRA